jgi:hypothetical protein
MKKLNCLISELTESNITDQRYELAFKYFEEIFPFIGKPEDLSEREERFKIELEDLIKLVSENLK